ncbi:MULTISPECIES: hypothetical protein [unclassified Ensifer]|uniref:hypothetical protein n=1 Tax=unclassified Ensifer TaxID=2633371 RepID=UPI000A7F57AC|nr:MULTISPECIES: hypothetical protein [unclassified Ensifer]
MNPLRSTQCIALSQPDIDTLQRVFDNICAEHHWPRDSEHARRHARMLIDEYLAGTTNEQLLLVVGRWFASRLPAETSTSS